MDNPIGLSQLQLDALKEISSIGAGNAVTALSQFLNKKVQMLPPEIIILAQGQSGRLITEAMPAVTVVSLEVTGEVSGHILAAFAPENAASLANLLLGNEPAGNGSASLSEIGVSAFKEVTSVMTGSYLRVMGDMMKITLRMSPPDFQSCSGGKINEAIIKSIKETGNTICLKSNLCVIDSPGDILGYLFFIPSSDALKVMLKLLGIEAASPGN
ncbi:MAG: chemotaxis protein CheC [Candidatus Omnitrophica bacterium]|nr:chemotaxis protein CheC [Candidatus Omnitrophota bacterium]